MQYLDTIIQLLDANPQWYKRLILRVLKYAIEQQIPQQQQNDIAEWWPA